MWIPIVCAKLSFFSMLDWSVNSNSPRRWCALRRGLLHRDHVLSATAGGVCHRHPHQQMVQTKRRLVIIEGAAVARLPRTARSETALPFLLAQLILLSISLTWICRCTICTPIWKVHWIFYGKKELRKFKINSISIPAVLSHISGT